MDSRVTHQLPNPRETGGMTAVGNIIAIGVTVLNVTTTTASPIVKVGIMVITTAGKD